MSEKRLELIEAAVELFASQGFHGTGIDRIAGHAGVSKKTMYHHFRSKEELIVAALRHHDSLFRNHFIRAVEQAGSTPRARLLAVFDVAHDWFLQRDFYGCLFINAIGEYSGRNASIREACKEYKRQIRDYIGELTSAVGAKDPEGLASELSILLEGSIVTAQVSELPGAAQTAQRAAEVLINNEIRTDS